MTKEKGRQWDGTSRPSDDTYRKRWEEIFGKRKEKKEEDEKQDTEDNG